MSVFLAGRKVLVTRAAHQAGKLSDGLRAAGIEPVEVPVLEIAPPLDFAPLDEALRHLASFDWVIFTSANAVRAVADRAAKINAQSVPDSLKVAAVGSATAAAAGEAGWTVSLVPESYVAESLVSALEGQVAGRRVLLARAEVARDVIPAALRSAGAFVQVVEAYRNVVPADAPARLSAALAAGINAATFTSSSSVTHLRDVAQAAGLPFPFPGVAAISIGTITSQTLREYSWEPAIEAAPHDIPGLIAATVLALTSENANS